MAHHAMTNHAWGWLAGAAGLSEAAAGGSKEEMVRAHCRVRSGAPRDPQKPVFSLVEALRRPGSQGRREAEAKRKASAPELHGHEATGRGEGGRFNTPKI